MTTEEHAAGEGADAERLSTVELEGLEQSIIPSPNLVSLDPDAWESYQSRLADAQGLASEQYQVNSRLRQADVTRMPTPQDEDALRTWFTESGRSFAPEDVASEGAPALAPFSTLPAPLGSYLEQVSSMAADGGLLYVADLHVLLGGWVWLVPPGQPSLIAERRLAPDRLERLRGAVRPDQQGTMGDASVILTLTVVPWRLQVLHGERGYRRALLEAGITLSRVASLAASAGMAPTPVIDFAEVTVDDCLFNDGVERFCIALVPLGASDSENGHPR